MLSVSHWYKVFEWFCFSKKANFGERIINILNNYTQNKKLKTHALTKKFIAIEEKHFFTYFMMGMFLKDIFFSWSFLSYLFIFAILFLSLLDAQLEVNC